MSRTDARAAGGGRLPAGLDGIGQEHHGTQLTHPWLRTSPCPGQRFGEVAAVLNEQHVPTHRRAHPRSAGPDGGQRQRLGVRPVQRGLRRGRAHLAGPAGTWRRSGAGPVDTDRGRALLCCPDRTRCSARPALACIAVVGQIGTSITAAYRSPAHHAVQSRIGPAVFASCVPSAAPGDEFDPVPSQARPTRPSDGGTALTIDRTNRAQSGRLVCRPRGWRWKPTATPASISSCEPKTDTWLQSTSRAQPDPDMAELQAPSFGSESS